MHKQPKKKRFYYDITIGNSLLANPSGVPVEATFNETRTQALFDGEPENYNLSVIRFTLPTLYIPYQIMPVEFDPTNPANPNRTIYSFTLKYNNVLYKQPVQWITQTLASPTPTPPPFTGIKTPDYYIYYSLYNLTYFCSLLNTTLDVCFQTNIVPLLPVVAGKSYVSPYFTYNPNNKLFSLWASGEFLTTSTLPFGMVGLYWNSNLGNIFDDSFNIQFLGFNRPDGDDNRGIIANTYNNSIPSSIDPMGFIYEQLQEFDITGFISKFQSILATTGGMPVVNDIVSNNLQQNTQGTNFGTVASNFLPIITDFEIDNSSGYNLKGFVHYLPTAEFRRIALKGKTPIKQIDISFYWRDVFGNVFPILIPSNSFASLKLLFEEA